jgi:hypothetical protein
MDFDGLLKWLGGIALATVSVSGISAAAIQGFKHFSEKWLDAKFARRLEELRHAHARELEDLRFRIAALLDRVTKLHAREFEVLPEAWSRLNDAFWQSIQFVSPFQSYPDLDRTPSPAREAFLEKCRLPDWEREEVRLAKEMNKKYQELIFKHDLHAAKDKFGGANSFLLKNGIFIEKTIRAQFQKLLDLIWNAIIEAEVNREIEHTARRRESTQALRSNGENMMKELEAVIHERLWPVNTASEPENPTSA